jgi:hypothetical protein
MIENARLAFPNLWEARAGEGGGKPTFGALLIIDPKNPAVQALEKATLFVAKEKWGAKADVILKGLKAQDRLVIHDGATKAQYGGFEGNLYISARSQGRPTVFGRNREPLDETDGKPYAGCYVNASVELWAQDNKYGKRVNAQLRGVQFRADGDAFAAGTPASEDEFQDLGDQGETETAEVEV